MQHKTVRARHAAKMRRVVGGFEKSGLTQVGYCRSRGISLRQFQYWRGKTQPKAKAGSFVELEVVDDGATSAGAIELWLPGGVVAIVGPGTRSSLIRRVLKASSSC